MKNKRVILDHNEASTEYKGGNSITIYTTLTKITRGVRNFQVSFHQGLSVVPVMSDTLFQSL